MPPSTGTPSSGAQVRERGLPTGAGRGRPGLQPKRTLSAGVGYLSRSRGFGNEAVTLKAFTVSGRTRYGGAGPGAGPAGEGTGGFAPVLETLSASRPWEVAPAGSGAFGVTPRDVRSLEAATLLCSFDTTLPLTHMTNDHCEKHGKMEIS